MVQYKSKGLRDSLTYSIEDKVKILSLIAYKQLSATAVVD